MNCDLPSNSWVLPLCRPLRRSAIPVFIERLLLILVIVLQAWVFLVAPTNINGDPNEYLHTARGLFSGDTSITFNRFIGYPLIIKLFSLNLHHLNLLFLCQSILFIIVLYHFAHALPCAPSYAVVWVGMLGKQEVGFGDGRLFRLYIQLLLCYFLFCFCV